MAHKDMTILVEEPSRSDPKDGFVRYGLSGWSQEPVVRVTWRTASGRMSPMCVQITMSDLCQAVGLAVKEGGLSARDVLIELAASMP